MAQDWIQFLIQTDQLQALAIYGSPYILDQVQPLLPQDVPYGFTYGQIPLAQELALQLLLQPLVVKTWVEQDGDRQFTT